MRLIMTFYTPAVAAFLLIAGICTTPMPVAAQSAPLDHLFSELQLPHEEQWADAAAKIETAWSKSGSDSMDLLLERGRAAMKAHEYNKALQHLTALTDHAPDFAEGWYVRAGVFYKIGEFGMAIHDIQKTLALTPRQYQAMWGLGRIYEDLDMPTQALAAYRAALAVHPHHANILKAVNRLQAQTEGPLL